MGTDYFRYAIFNDPQWDWRTFDIVSAMAAAERVVSGITDASPELAAFKQRGGKLLLYHGWQDQNFSAQATINYYQAVLNKVGSGSEWLRLFLAPGMGHCGGGEGPNTFDMLTALEQWVEQGKAADSMTASFVAEGKTIRTRPLCPYPQTARYVGKGSIDDAANFICRAP